MKGKRILAKVLAAAVVATSILPGWGLKTEAAPKIQTETTSQWMHKESDGRFSITQDNWLNAETNAKFEKWGPTKLVGAGISTWRLASSETDGNTNGDMSADTGDKTNSAPACVYASGIDITSQPDERKVMRFVFYPQDDYQYDQIRLGIMLKYVDSTHWAFLGYNGRDWWVEWKMGDQGSWADAGQGYTNSENQSVDSWNPDLRTMRMEKDQHFRITLTYEDASHIKLRMAVCDRTEDEEGKPVLVEKEGSAKEAVLDFKIFEDLRTYAQEGETAKEIHMGFVAGTHPTSTNKPLTDINIENVMMGALVKKAEGENPTAESTNAADWKTPLALINYEDCEWMSPKEGKEAEDILIQQLVGEGITYAAIGDPENDDKKNPNATIYNKTVTDFTEGEVSSVLRPYEVGSGKEFYLGVLSLPEESGTAGKSIRLGINNNEWGYKVDDGDFQSLGSEPAIEALTDYNVTMKIDAQGKVTAKVAYEEAAEAGKF